MIYCPGKTLAEIAQTYKRAPTQIAKIALRDHLVRCMIQEIGGTNNKKAFEQQIKSIKCNVEEDADGWSQLHNSFRQNVTKCGIKHVFQSTADAVAMKKKRKRPRRENRRAHERVAEVIAHSENSTDSNARSDLPKKIRLPPGLSLPVIQEETGLWRDPLLIDTIYPRTFQNCRKLLSIPRLRNNIGFQNCRDLESSAIFQNCQNMPKLHKGIRCCIKLFIRFMTNND